MKIWIETEQKSFTAFDGSSKLNSLKVNA